MDNKQPLKLLCERVLFGDFELVSSNGIGVEFLQIHDIACIAIEVPVTERVSSMCVR